jgi:adenylate cyclase
MRWKHWLLPYVAASALLVGFQASPAAETLNLLVYDVVASLRETQHSPDDGAITVVGIDEADLKTFKWPIPDRHLCGAIQRLEALGASAIGLDLYRDPIGTDSETCLSTLIQANPRLISIHNIADAIPAIPGTPPRQQAFNDLVVDGDRVVRRDLVHVGGQSEAIRSLPLRLLETARGNPTLHRKLEALPAGVWLQPQSGGYQRLDTSGYQTMLPVHPPGRFPIVSLRDLLAGRVDASSIRDRIVLIGSTAPSLKDQFEIPQSRLDQGERFLELPGVELHAQRIASLQALLRDGQAPIRTASALQRHLLLAAMLLLGIAIAERPHRIRRSSLLLGLSALALFGTSVLLLLEGFWIGIALPLSGLLLFGSTGILRRGAISQRHQQEMGRLLGQATSPAVAQQLWEQRDDLIQDGRFTGREQPVTILFTDTCHFTRVSEQLSPAALMDWLNVGMAIGVDAVTSRGGMVNKFTGDGMLAVFGAPISAGLERDASQALEAARAIQTEIATLNQDLQARGAWPLKLRIGIHSGLVLTGSLGSRSRLEYAVIGDTVNCASRLESLEKERHQGWVRILISAESLNLAGVNPKDDTVIDWGEVDVKGRREPLRVFEWRDQVNVETGINDTPQGSSPATEN